MDILFANFNLATSTSTWLLQLQLGYFNFNLAVITSYFKAGITSYFKAGITSYFKAGNTSYFKAGNNTYFMHAKKKVSLFLKFNLISKYYTTFIYNFYLSNLTRILPLVPPRRPLEDP